MQKLFSLWINKSDKGKKYMSGQIQDNGVSFMLHPGSRILVFKNKSDSENSPAYDVFVSSDNKDKSSSKKDNSDDMLEDDDEEADSKQLSEDGEEIPF